jgi:phosphate transport system substrate-binding protein
MMDRRQFLTAAAMGVAAGAVKISWAQDGPPKLDPGLKSYQVVAGVSGNASSIGSDTLNNLMTFWAEGFKKAYPNVNIQIEGKGSGTAPPALTGGQSQFGPMSRAMKPTELDAFDAKYGYKPTQVRVAVDALGIFVNKDNPIKSLALEQADAIFSKTRRRGAVKQISTWGDAGLTGEWADKPISVYGRNSASGTYGFFKEHVLKTGDFRDEVKEQPGSASVVLAVATDRFAIGYSGIGYATSSVRAVALSEKAGAQAMAANAENAYSGEYPLARFLYIYINRAPGKPLDPMVREFIRMVCSKEGQEIVVKDGYFPILAAVANEELKKVE